MKTTELSLEDAINGLKHMADDHKCCEPFITATITKFRQMEYGIRMALWIQGKLEERGSFGASLAEWDDIKKALQ